MADEITLKEEIPTKASNEPVSEPIESTIPPEPEIPTVESEPTLNSNMESGATAQIPVNEPLDIPEEPKIEPEPEITPKEVKTDKTEDSIVPEPAKEEIKPKIHESVQNGEKVEKRPEPEQQKVIPVIISMKSKARELLIKARNAIRSRKRKKLDRVLSLFAKQTKITNDEVEKFLHVSDATATRYLSQLEKEGKIKQNGKTGKSVFYIKI